MNGSRPYAHLLVREEPPLAWVELNRPAQLNALSTALRRELVLCLGALTGDDRVKAVVLTGGPRCFSAGFDLKEVLATDFRALGEEAAEFVSATSFFEKPLVTAVAGVAYAGGFDLAQAGDVIVAAEDARLGRPEVGFGVNPLLVLLSRRIGMARALRLSLTGEILDAAQALALGVVDRVVPGSRLAAVAAEEAQALARHPLPALRALKRAARAVPALDGRSAVEYELGLAAELLAEGTLRSALRQYARERGIVRD